MVDIVLDVSGICHKNSKQPDQIKDHPAITRYRPSSTIVIMRRFLKYTHTPL